MVCVQQERGRLWREREFVRIKRLSNPTNYQQRLSMST